MRKIATAPLSTGASKKGPRSCTNDHHDRVRTRRWMGGLGGLCGLSAWRAPDEADNPALVVHDDL
jgi:hypothetical protein